LKSRLHEYIEDAAKEFYPTNALPSLVAEAEAEAEAVVGQNMEDDLSQKEHRKILQAGLISQWRETVGGYFLRFMPNFSGPAMTTRPVGGDTKGVASSKSLTGNTSSTPTASRMPASATGDGSWESILTYAFLRADLDFITGKWRSTAEHALALEEGSTEKGGARGQGQAAQAQGDTAFAAEPHKAKSGSTASIALIFTP